VAADSYQSGDRRSRLRRLLGNARWRVRFFGWYVIAASRAKIPRYLLGASKRAFAHPWVSNVTMVLQPQPGFSERCHVSVDAPIVIVVWHRGRQALFLACHVVRKTLTIEQLQGSQGMNVPRELAWTTRCLAACQEVARLTNLRQVRITRAQSLPAFRNPSVTATTQEEFEEIRGRIRASLVRRYDESAEQLGFTLGRRYSVWRNPNFVSRGRILARCVARATAALSSLNKVI
jgi:hypothetical protein